ncbi:hypothetical protein Leryth_012358, partial [Lithospermum erythrorhizon]
MVSDTKSSLSMALTLPLNGSTPAMPKAVSSGGYITVVPRNKLGVAKINTVVDSMRASSPTRKSLDSDDHKAWILGHPSALSMFKEIIHASKGKQIVMFLDYDGTLSPIVEDPDRAFMANEMRQAVRDVSKYFPTAIVSGRCIAKVFNFVRLEEVYYAGSHGMDIKGPGKLGHLDKKVLEIRPNIKWDKGNAVEFLLESLGYDANSNDVFAIFIGDDLTDEDAFKVPYVYILLISICFIS